MTEEIDLREIEKKAWGTFCSKDGLYDIFIGIMLLTLAIQSFVYNIWFTSIIFISILIVPLGKKYITVPRIGRVKFGPARQIKLIKMVVAIGIAVSATFVLYLIQIYVEDPPPYLGSIWIASLVATIFGAMAYYMSYLRLFIYGLMFAVGEILWRLFGEPTGPLAMLVFGIAMIFIGVIVLVRFIRQYPVPAEEAING